MKWELPLPENVGKREFILFDEQFQLELTPTDDDEVNLIEFTVWINEGIVVKGPADTYFEQQNGRWILRDNVCRDYLFRSSVVMNNGYDNVMKFRVTYSDASKMSNSIESSSSVMTKQPLERILSSFEPVYTWNAQPPSKSRDETPDLTTPPQEEANVKTDETTEEQVIQFQFPVYSLLNMRLRNSNLKNQYCILTSLDFQTSKSLLLLVERFKLPLQETSLQFQQVRLELVDKQANNDENRCHIEVESIDKDQYQFPLIANPHDSFSMAYKLPPLTSDDTQQKSGDSDDMKPHRVRITLDYNVHFDKTSQPLHVMTQWETDVTIKRKQPRGNVLKKNGSQLMDNNTANLSRISTISISSTARFYNNTATNTNQNRLSSYKPVTTGTMSQAIRFRFVQESLTVTRGQKFTLRLQITNLSPQPLDLVIYYNNQTPNVANTVTAEHWERQVLALEHQRQQAEGLILLNNDYKLPLIHPQESYFVDLSFVAVRSGFHQTLGNLRMLELKSQEVLEVGRSVSLVVV